MNNETRKDLILGMCVALAHTFRSEFNEAQEAIFENIISAINHIYYLNPPETIK